VRVETGEMVGESGWFGRRKAANFRLVLYLQKLKKKEIE
jgi:hypothetical protein